MDELSGVGVGALICYAFAELELGQCSLIDCPTLSFVVPISSNHSNRICLAGLELMPLFF